MNDFEGLPDELLVEIVHRLDLQSTCILSVCNRRMRSISKGHFPYSRRLLNSQMSEVLAENRRREDWRDPYLTEFFYGRSLQTRADMEVWAYRALYTQNAQLYKNVREAIYREAYVPRTCSGWTSEQEALVEVEPSGRLKVLVQAYAGTGKTTTLLGYAKRWKEYRMLYVAFNASLAKGSKAKFGAFGCTNVQVYTLHSYVLAQLVDRGELSAMRVENELSKVDFERLAERLWGRELSSEKREQRMKTTWSAFEEYCSTCLELRRASVLSQRIWELMFTDELIPVTHTAYLKYYQLGMQRDKASYSKSWQEYDVLMVDEVQDCTNCMLDIVCGLTDICKVFVGDAYQKLYGFTHVEDPYGFIEGYADEYTLQKRTLSVSFRFGYSLMRLCNRFLQQQFGKGGFRSTRRGKTYTEVDTQGKIRTAFDAGMYHYAQLSRDTTFICRYNYTLLCLMFDVSMHGYTYHTPRKLDFEYEEKVANELQRMALASYPKETIVGNFTDVNSFTTYVFQMNMTEWKTRLRLYAKYGDELVNCWRTAARQWREEGKSDEGFGLITAHQSKGLEFDHVVIANDFMFNTEDGAYVMYVALSRARRSVYINDALDTYFCTTRECVRTDGGKHPTKSGRCKLCGTRQTDQTMYMEADDEVVTTGQCELYMREYACVTCKHRHHIFARS